MTQESAAREATAAPRIRTYGFRVDRSGGVYAYLAQPRRGRCPQHSQMYVGSVRRERGGWRNEAVCDIHPTQTEAAQRLVTLICG
jgi:hypothetical protein